MSTEITVSSFEQYNGEVRWQVSAFISDHNIADCWYFASEAEAEQLAARLTAKFGS